MKKLQRGYMIDLESTEGAGKGTASLWFKEYFEEKGIDCVFTREPGGTPLAEEIRSMLLQKRDEKMHDLTELLLMFAARSQHLNALILPALESSKFVLSERFVDSSISYQGWARGMDINTIEDLTTMVCGSFVPDLTIILDIDAATGLERARKRAELDRIEEEEVEFFERARQGFLNQAKKHPHRYAVIDASKSISEVQSQLRSVMDEFIRKTEKVSNYNSDELTPSL